MASGGSEGVVVTPAREATVIIREPVVAGHFYAAGTARCAADLDALLSEAEILGGAASEPLLGGLVPHAG